MSRPAIVYFTNLYPLPWEPTRAAYNFQIVEALRVHADVDVIIPVPATTWLKQLFKGNIRNTDKAILFPFFFIPGVGRRTYAVSMMISLIIAVKPCLKLVKAKHIVASWAYPEGVVASWFKRLFNSHVIIHCVGTDINYHFQQPARRRQMLKAFDAVEHVITVSRDLAKKIQQHASNKADVTTVYNGVNFDAFSAPPVHSAIPTLLFIGNWLTTKGVYELIDAMALLRDKGVIAQLQIVGKGPEAQGMAKRIQQHHLDQMVTLHGPVLHKDVPQLLAKANALILPSYREGVPNVIMEALAAGVAPVATAVGGIPEIIKDNHNGILIHELNAASVAEAIERALNTPWSAAQLRQSIAEFTWGNCAKGFLQALKSEA